VKRAEHKMTKGDFRKLFLKALNAAADNAEAGLATPVPRSFRIELHAPGSMGTAMSVDEALDKIWLGNNRFYRVIDVAIKEALPGRSLAFARVSGHAPTRFENTWDPSNLGPFKQIVAEQVNDRRAHAD
jgi:hypothetical protein